jgi:hypothetical protein
LYTGGERREVESRELKLERKEENAETHREEVEPVVGKIAMKCEKRKRDSQEGLSHKSPQR